MYIDGVFFVCQNDVTTSRYRRAFNDQLYPRAMVSRLSWQLSH